MQMAFYKSQLGSRLFITGSFILFRDACPSSCEDAVSSPPGHHFLHQSATMAEQYRHQALAPTTLTAYQVGFNCYRGFCQLSGFNPHSAIPSPPSEELLKCFVVHCANKDIVIQPSSYICVLLDMSILCMG